MTSVKLQNIRMDMLVGKWENFIEYAQKEYVKSKVSVNNKREILTEVPIKEDIREGAPLIKNFLIYSFAHANVATSANRSPSIITQTESQYIEICETLITEKHIIAYHPYLGSTWTFSSGRTDFVVQTKDSRNLHKKFQLRDYKFTYNVFGMKDAEEAECLVCHIEVK